MVSRNVLENIRLLAISGDRVRAIQLLRDEVTISFKDAVKTIDSIAAGDASALDPYFSDESVITGAFEAQGVQGSLELLEDRVVIKRKGVMAALAHGLKGDKEILLSSISSIQWREPGALTNGYIQFAFQGGREAKGGLLQAGQDENTVLFSRAQKAAFARVKAEIERRRSAPVTQREPTAPSALDQLERFAALKERGLLTEEEFTAKKRELLGL